MMMRNVGSGWIEGAEGTFQVLARLSNKNLAKYVAKEWSDGEEQRWEIRGASVTLLENSQRGTICKEGVGIAMGK